MFGSSEISTMVKVRCDKALMPGNTWHGVCSISFWKGSKHRKSENWGGTRAVSCLQEEGGQPSKPDAKAQNKGASGFEYGLQHRLTNT